jgi:hypothetical protein
LSHSVGYFWDRVSCTICLGLGITIMISASWVARIIGMSHQHLALPAFIPLSIFHKLVLQLWQIILSHAFYDKKRMFKTTYFIQTEQTSPIEVEFHQVTQPSGGRMGLNPVSWHPTPCFPSDQGILWNSFLRSSCLGRTPPSPHNNQNHQPNSGPFSECLWCSRGSWAPPFNPLHGPAREVGPCLTDAQCSFARKWPGWHSDLYIFVMLCSIFESHRNYTKNSSEIEIRQGYFPSCTVCADTPP